MDVSKRDQGPAIKLPQQGKAVVQEAVTSPLMEMLMRIGGAYADLYERQLLEEELAVSE